MPCRPTACETAALHQKRTRPTHDKVRALILSLLSPSNVEDNLISVSVICALEGSLYSQ